MVFGVVLGGCCFWGGFECFLGGFGVVFGVVLSVFWMVFGWFLVGRLFFLMDLGDGLVGGEKRPNSLCAFSFGYSTYYPTERSF